MKELFKHKAFVAIFGFVLLMATLACTCSALPFGGDEEEATAVVEADGEDESAATSEPADVAVTPEGGSQDGAGAVGDISFVAVSDAETGLALEYPSSWHLVQEFGYQLYSDAALEDAEQIGDGAGVFVFGGFPPDEPPIEAINGFLDDDNDFENVELLEEPHSLTINGNEAAQLVARADVDGEQAQVMVTVISSADNSATVLAMSSAATADDYRPLFDQIIGSLVLSTPEFSFELPTPSSSDGDEPVPTTESSSGDGEVNLGGFGANPGGANLVFDRVFVGPASSSEPAVFSFPARAGRAVVIMAISPSESDLTLTIFDPQDNEVGYVDDEISDAPEYYVLDPTADGTYRIEVAPFTGTGDFMIGVLGLAADAPGMLLTDMDSTENGTVDYGLTATGNGAFLVYMAVEADADLTLTLLDANGNELVNIDEGWSGEPEVLFYQTDGAAEYTLRVDDFTAGSYELYIGGAELMGPPPAGGGNDGGNAGDNGNAGGDIDGAAIPATDEFNSAYPVIDGATGYLEAGGVVIYQLTDYGLAEVAAFYRYQAAQNGLTERSINTFISEDVVSIVFDGSDGELWIVQVVPLGEGEINVAISSEE